MNVNEEGEICVYSCASVVRKSALGRPETKWGLARMERAKPVVQTFDVLVASQGELLLRQPCRRSYT
jgi:hypothetical protein